MLKYSFIKSNLSKLSLAVGDDEISPVSTINIVVSLDCYLNLDK